MDRQAQCSDSGRLVVPSDKASAIGSVSVGGIDASALAIISSSGSVSGNVQGNSNAYGRDKRQRSAGTGRTIVIGMSAAGFNNDEKAAQVGMDGFLVKPFRLDEMMGIITARANANGAGAGIGNGNGRRSGSGHFNVTAVVSGTGSASVGLW